MVIAEGRSFKEVLKTAHKWLVEHPEVDPDSLELIEEVRYYPISIHALCLLELEQRVGPEAIDAADQYLRDHPEEDYVDFD